VFRTPGKHPVPISTEVTPNEWIKLAAPVWWDIRETDVLPVLAARGQDDERHLCPLQLPFIRNCIRLWSGKGEVVLDPFNGVGSTGHEAVKLGRKYVGVELKPSYYKVAASNLRAAEASSTTMDMFAHAGVTI
jgi:DNA modification methylase